MHRGSLGRLPRAAVPGVDPDGCWADLVAVPVHNLIPLPGDLDPAVAAVATDAVAAAFHAVVSRGAARHRHVAPADARPLLRSIGGVDLSVELFGRSEPVTGVAGARGRRARSHRRRGPGAARGGLRSAPPCSANVRSSVRTGPSRARWTASSEASPANAWRSQGLVAEQIGLTDLPSALGGLRRGEVAGRIVVRL